MPSSRSKVPTALFAALAAVVQNDWRGGDKQDDLGARHMAIEDKAARPFQLIRWAKGLQP